MIEEATHPLDVLILGAGAAGLYAAIFAGRRGRRVCVLDHAEAAGKKILISGGGGLQLHQSEHGTSSTGRTQSGPRSRTPISCGA
jgi:predicted flavoprotein YhiN